LYGVLLGDFSSFLFATKRGGKLYDTMMPGMPIRRATYCIIHELLLVKALPLMSDNLSTFFCTIPSMYLIPPRGSLLASGPYPVPARAYCKPVLPGSLRKIHFQDLPSSLYTSKLCSSRSNRRLCLFVFKRPCSSLQESLLSLLKVGSPSLESSSSPLLDGSTFSNAGALTPMKQAPAPD
jgi:hypothetical protein